MEIERLNRFDFAIDEAVVRFLVKDASILNNYEKANDVIEQISGIKNFFNNQLEAVELSDKLNNQELEVSKVGRREFGDFQTNGILTDQVTQYAFKKNPDIEFILEPTCGQGNFIISSLKKFKNLKKLVGVEIYQPYIWETKFKILSFYLRNEDLTKPEIEIFHESVFEYSFSELANSTKDLKTLIVGNPPWVTSSELGSIASQNLPKKSNFKKVQGFEAITGKSNFDLGEYISLLMLRNFHHHNGLFAFLIKNSVIKNLIQDQFNNPYNIGNCESLRIDAKKEFNVSVSAALFLAQLCHKPEYICRDGDFYSKVKISSFGWYKNKFVSSIDDYDEASFIDGKSTFTWRSGVKHDCSKVMELKKINGHYINGLQEEIKLEENLVYGLIKSSDLKVQELSNSRRFTIITQKKIGKETGYIKEKYPLTYNYLSNHKEYFDRRKSSIYKDKPNFSIFGVGDYSFALYKVAISGLYKSTHFTIVKPNDTKPLMLDDTCYFIGFNTLKEAQIAHLLLNSEMVQTFLKSVIFSDAKRAVNKDTLMRIDLRKVFEFYNLEWAQKKLTSVTGKEWDQFGQLLKNEGKSGYNLKFDFE